MTCQTYLHGLVSICGASMTYPTHFHEWCLSVVPGWPAQHIAWMVSICGASMTCPTHFHQCCLSVVPAWPAQHIFISGVYLWCQDCLPSTFAWVVSIYGVNMTCPTHLQQWCLSVVPAWLTPNICIRGVCLWFQDDLPNIFAWLVSICGASMTCPTHFHQWCLSCKCVWQVILEPQIDTTHGMCWASHAGTRDRHYSWECVGQDIWRHRYTPLMQIYSRSSWLQI